jgi:hypothetical protein
MMKKTTILSTMVIARAIVIVTVALVSCTALYRGVEGDIYEKMTIFSMIVFTIFAVILIPFLTSKVGSRELARYREAVKGAPAQPLSQEDLTSYPVYVWDSRRSFRKMVFSGDGALSDSSIVTANGLDPTTHPSGTWSLGPDGILHLSLNVTAGTRSYARISEARYNLAALMRLSSGYVEAWYIGANSLARAQISCFGYSDSVPATEKFTVPLVNGLTVYWGTYPSIIPMSTDEVSINPELAYGVMTFQEDGTLSKSINNPIDAGPNYEPSFTGTWRVNEEMGVLYLSVGLYTTEVTLLLHNREPQSLLIRTTAGNEQWFLDQQHAAEDLARYLAISVHLDAGKSSLFADSTRA